MGGPGSGPRLGQQNRLGTGKGVDDGVHGYRLGDYTPSEYKRIKEGIPKSVKERKHDDPVYDRVGLFKDITSTPKNTQMDMIPKDVNERNGLCYKIAGDFIMGNPTWTVTHAHLYPRSGKFKDKEYFHGFAEKGGVVFDPVLGQFFSKAGYYKYFEPTEVRSYSQKDWMKKALKSGNYGPWD